MINAKEQVIIGEYTATMHGVVAATVIRNFKRMAFSKFSIRGWKICKKLLSQFI